MTEDTLDAFDPRNPDIGGFRCTDCEEWINEWEDHGECERCAEMFCEVCYGRHDCDPHGN